MRATTAPYHCFVKACPADRAGTVDRKGRNQPARRDDAISGGRASTARCGTIASEPNTIRIDDPDDPRVDAYRAIRERDLVGRDGLFIAEGEVVLRALLRSRLHAPVSLLLAENRIAGLAPLLGQVPAAVPIYAARPAVLDGIAGFPLHRGILALGRRGPLPDAASLLAACGPRALVVVLFGTANHDNLGGVFRNAAGFGADAVLLDAQCCDPLYRKAIRVSVGAALLMPWARLATDEDPVALLACQGFEPLALSPAGATPLARYRRPARVAALFGAEGPGLPSGLMARVRTVSIPMAGGFDSLNLATTSGIVLHHLACGEG
jgi:tRNA G18 (ribose-2'-O)-methylase SpoU